MDGDEDKLRAALSAALSDVLSLGCGGVGKYKGDNPRWFKHHKRKGTLKKYTKKGTIRKRKKK